MTLYFPSPRPSMSSTTTESQFQDFPYLMNHTDEELTNQMISSSTLIFPTAPSSSQRVESSGNSISSIDTPLDWSDSTPSLPTDMSIESLHREEAGTRRNGTLGSRQSVSRALSFDAHVRRWHNEMVLEEVPSLPGSEVERGYMRPQYAASRLTLDNSPGQNLATSGGIRSRVTSSGLSTPSSRQFLSLAPQLPFRLPLLPFLKSCLALDESTLHLISRSSDPHYSALFAVSPGYPPSPLDDDDDDDESQASSHGVLKLLLSNPDKPQNTALLKAGMDLSETPSDANPLLINPTRTGTGVWRLLELVIEGGARMWKEVKAWDSGEKKSVRVLKTDT